MRRLEVDSAVRQVVFDLPASQGGAAVTHRTVRSVKAELKSCGTVTLGSWSLC